MRTRMLLFLLVLGLGVAAPAQEAAPPAPARPAKTKKARPPDRTAPQAPEMAKLVRLLQGRWKVNMKFEAMPEMGAADQGGTGKGGEVIEPGPGGNSLISNLRARSAAGVFTGHGVMWWDAKARLGDPLGIRSGPAGAYRSVWCDNETPACDASATGAWEGDNLVFTVDVEFPGPEQRMIKMKMRQVYSEMTEDSFTFYIDSSIEGGPMKRMLTATYKRIGPRPAAPPAKKP